MSGYAPGRTESTSAWRVTVEALPLTALLTATLMWAAWSGTATSDAAVDVPAAQLLQPVHARSAADLKALFRDHGYRWPVRGDSVPPLALQSLPGDLDAQAVPLKKSLFFRTLLPMVLAENRSIRRKRERLKSVIARGGPRNAEEKAFIANLQERYRVKGDFAERDTRRQLLRRVDTVPPALALAQAAIESGWGGSRFAREGNNLFGEWTWNAKLGLVPKKRRAEDNHFVRRFGSLRQSVASYLNNLNTHPAYRRLRRIRANARSAGRAPTAGELARGLTSYSQRGKDYVREVLQMLHNNDLASAIRGARLEAPGETVARESP